MNEKSEALLKFFREERCFKRLIEPSQGYSIRFLSSFRIHYFNDFFDKVTTELMLIDRKILERIWKVFYGKP